MRSPGTRADKQFEVMTRQIERIMHATRGAGRARSVQVGRPLDEMAIRPFIRRQREVSSAGVWKFARAGNGRCARQGRR